MENVEALLPKARRSKRHHRVAPYKEMPGIVRALQAKRQGADTAVNQAAEFIILTAVRTSEARYMRVGEVDGNVKYSDVASIAIWPPAFSAHPFRQETSAFPIWSSEGTGGKSS